MILPQKYRSSNSFRRSSETSEQLIKNRPLGNFIIKIPNLALKEKIPLTT